MTRLGRGHRSTLLSFLLPGLIYLVLIRYIPALFTFYSGFTSWNLLEQKTPKFIGLANYSYIFSDGNFDAALLRTVIFTIVATSLELVLGLAVALFVNRDFRGKGLLRGVIILPMIVTPAIVGVIWKILYSDVIGPINAGLAQIGLPTVGWLTNIHMAMVSVVIMDLWHWTPFVFLIVLSALQTIPTELYDAAEVDGSTRWQRLRFVTLPFIRESLIVAAILRSVQAFNLFDEPYVMTGGGPGQATETVSLYIYKYAFQFFQLGRSGAMIIISLLLLGLVYGLYLRFVDLEQ